MMDLGLKDKCALVTGGTHGIGRSIALRLAEEGCRVAVCSRTRERVAAVLEDLKKRNADCLGIQADVTVAAEVDKVMQTVTKKWGALHILVNNVGGGGRWGEDSIEGTPEDVWREAYEKNVMSAVRFTQRAIPYMRHEQWGRVVTITSLYGREAGGRPWFTMAKTAQTAFMKSLAVRHDLAREGLTFNSVAPGVIMIPDTGWDRALREDRAGTEAFIRGTVPVERFGAPEEVADIVVFLCSARAAFINGASIVVDGGQGHSIL